MLTENQIKALRNYLKSNNITQKDFASMIGVARNTVSRYLNKEGTPSLSVKKLIFKLTKINLEK